MIACGCVSGSSLVKECGDDRICHSFFVLSGATGAHGRQGGVKRVLLSGYVLVCGVTCPLCLCAIPDPGPLLSPPLALHPERGGGVGVAQSSGVPDIRVLA